MHGNKCSTITWPWVFRVESYLWLHRGFLLQNPASGCVTDFEGRILVTVTNAFSNSSFISTVCAHTVFERSIDKQRHNPSGTSSDGWGVPLEQNNLAVGNSKTRRILHQQLTIIYCSMFRLQTVGRERERERERERICKGLWIDKKRHASQLDRTFWVQNSNWLLFQNSLIFIYLKSGYRWGWCDLAKLLDHLSRVQNSLFLFLQSNLSQTRYESILFSLWPSCVERYVLA